MNKVFSSPATFVGASLVGALLLAGYLGVVSMDKPDAAPAGRVAAMEAESAPTVARTAAEPALPQAARAQPVLAGTACPTQPKTAARNAEDGRFTLEAALGAGAGIEPAAFVTVAREAARQGRLRDAEVALLAACHVAERRSGSGSPAVADLQAQIASLQDPAQFRVLAGAPAQHSPTSVMGAAKASSEEATDAARLSRGSAVQLIRSDPELAQLEHDMERLRAQASRVTRDPAGLRQRDSQAIARRDAGCQDKGCLLRWYAQRRAQLLDEF